MEHTVYAVILGFLLDILLGDPVWLYHPVRLIGHAITWTEKGLRRIFLYHIDNNRMAERIAGGLMVVMIIVVSAGIPWGILYLVSKYSKILAFLIEIWMCYQILAARSLYCESMKVFYCLKAGDTKGARRAVSMIVGRDTKSLDDAGITRAAVETVAENTSDGVIAPMFYLVIGGPVLGFVYKAINTMDSMVGYKNEKYRYFGTAAAKLDDLVNFIPARLSALIMILASWFCRMDYKNAWHIFKRDRYQHASPNSAQTEAVMAGALDLKLAGDAWYFGKLHKKPSIGDDLRKIEAADIKRANILMYMTAVLSLVIFAGLGFALI